MRCCERCGKQLPDDAKFCSNCGAAVNNILFRNDCDVELTVSVKVKDSIDSKTENYVFLPHLKKAIYVSVPNNIKKGQLIQLKGLGKRKNDKQGNLYLKIEEVEHLKENVCESDYKDCQTNRKEEWAGKIIKCPSCGERIPSFTAICPTCGHEFRGNDPTSSIKELATKLEEATTDKERAYLIRTFPIPNTREDILEFMILASTNIENSYQTIISEAWSVKFEQAYEKSTILYGQQPEFIKYNELFLKKKKENNRIVKKKGHQLGRKKFSIFFEKNKEWILPGAIILGLISLVICPRMSKVYKLERLINQVERSIAADDLENARIKANQIIDDSDWSTESKEKYDGIRNSLLDMIDEKEIAMGYKIYIGSSGKEYKGQNYLKVVSELQDKGFNNIQTKPLEDLITGWLKDDGDIARITINGLSDFTEKSSFAPDAEIIITYHTYKS